MADGGMEDKKHMRETDPQEEEGQRKKPKSEEDEDHMIRKMMTVVEEVSEEDLEKQVSGEDLEKQVSEEEKRTTTTSESDDVPVRRPFDIHNLVSSCKSLGQLVDGHSNKNKWSQVYKQSYAACVRVFGGGSTSSGCVVLKLKDFSVILTCAHMVEPIESSVYVMTFKFETFEVVDFFIGDDMDYAFLIVKGDLGGEEVTTVEGYELENVDFCEKMMCICHPGVEMPWVDTDIPDDDMLKFLDYVGFLGFTGVIAHPRLVGVDPTNRKGDYVAFETDNSLIRGSSGAPLINAQGQLFAICTICLGKNHLCSFGLRISSIMTVLLKSAVVPETHNKEFGSVVRWLVENKWGINLD